MESGKVAFIYVPAIDHMHAFVPPLNPSPIKTKSVSPSLISIEMYGESVDPVMN